MAPNIPNSKKSCLSRKIPGPVSKTRTRALKQVKQEGVAAGISSNDPAYPVEPNHTLVSVKRNRNSNKMSLPPPASRLPTAVKSTCLFCSDPFIINEDVNSAAAKERNEAIKTLCFHMQMDPSEVPKNCTAELTPLCKVCIRLVLQLWENEKIIQEAQKKISKNIATIERTVVDAELLRTTANIPGPSTAAGEDKKFTKLRDTILDGYRNKLLMKQKLRENLILGNEMKIQEPVYSHTAIMEDRALSRQYNTNRGRIFPSTSTSTSQNNEDPENVTAVAVANVNPPEIARSSRSTPAPPEAEGVDEQAETHVAIRGNDNSLLTNVSSQNPPEGQHQQKRIYRRVHRVVGKPTTAAGTASANWMGPGVVGRYNEGSCTMVISDVRSDTENPSPSPSSIETPSIPVVIKQEPGTGGNLAPAPVAAGKRKRRTLFQGIEIVRMTDPRTNRVLLQCSICRITVPVTTYSTGMSPYQTMTQHITDKHLGKRRRAALSIAAGHSATTIKRRQFTCKICSKVFQNKKSLFDHKASHATSSPPQQATPPARSNATPSTAAHSSSHSYYIENLECDVCGRPVKGNLSNLMAHKFSHKNNEERQAAIAAGERGSRNALLRTTPGPKRRPVVINKYRNKKVRKSRGKAKPFGSVSRGPPKKDRDIGLIQCQVCHRVFNRNCHLALHMQGHARRSQIPGLIVTSKAKSKAVTNVARSQQVQEERQNPEDDANSQELDSFQDHEESQANHVPNSGEYAQNHFAGDDEMNYNEENENPFDLTTGVSNEAVV